MKPPKYTAEQTAEIIERIKTLRMRWLSVVETKLDRQRGRNELNPSSQNLSAAARSSGDAIIAQ